MLLPRSLSNGFYATTLATATLLAMAGCSTSSEPPSHITDDGFEIRMTSNRQRPVVGDGVTLEVSIENTTSAELQRVFAPGDLGPIARSTSPNVEMNGFDGSFFDQVVDLDTPHTITIPAHGTVYREFHLVATHIGMATITACFPENDNAPQPNVCATRTLSIAAQ